MNHDEIIRDYLKGKRSLASMPDGSGYPFVTVSRQAGAGGHTLAYVLLTDFANDRDQEVFGGWHVFDRELCEVVAQDRRFQNSLEALITESYRSETSQFLDSLFAGWSKQDILYRTTFRMVRMLAILGKVIIVGRGGACVTRTVPKGIHIRLVAPESQRIIWMMKRFNMAKEEAVKTVHRQDADRKKMMNAVFNRDISDPLLYHAVWNTTMTGMHEISHSIMEMIRHRAKGKIV